MIPMVSSPIVFYFIFMLFNELFVCLFVCCFTSFPYFWYSSQNFAIFFSYTCREGHQGIIIFIQCTSSSPLFRHDSLFDLSVHQFPISNYSNQFYNTAKQLAALNIEVYAHRTLSCCSTKRYYRTESVVSLTLFFQLT